MVPQIADNGQFRGRQRIESGKDEASKGDLGGQLRHVFRALPIHHAFVRFPMLFHQLLEIQVNIRQTVVEIDFFAVGCRRFILSKRNFKAGGGGILFQAILDILHLHVHIADIFKENDATQNGRPDNRGSRNRDGAAGKPDPSLSIRRASRRIPPW